MKFFVISILVFFLCGSAFGLKCYECNKEQSTVACNHPEVVVCGVGMEMCAEVSISFNGKKGVGKYCAPKCPIMQYSADFLGAKLDVNCCQGNLCNASEKVSKNKLLFSAVAVYAFFKLFF